MFWVVGVASLVIDLVMFIIAMSSLNNNRVLPATAVGIAIFAVTYVAMVAAAIIVAVLNHKYSVLMPPVIQHDGHAVTTEANIASGPPHGSGQYLDIVTNAYTHIAAVYCGAVCGLSVAAIAS
jgi:uncharacterized protein YebE (UPF0316 family)